MSDAFAFMFAFYGLLLGLAVAEIASGFSRAYANRRIRRLGVVAPMFGALLLVDLITFWMNAWAYRDLEKINYAVAFAVAIVALLYYFAATQVFPSAGETDTLDDHIMIHRREVGFCVLASNLMTQIPPAISMVTDGWPLSNIVIWSGLNLSYYALLATAALAKSKKVVIAALGVAILLVTGATAILA
ncbi:hypothetical protein [Rhizobium sp. G21]|uniref:hypothetical protein n=1 Tax=Rhizobium sp. G21 TaxID=2758439 RepID=UPI0016048EEB|nr:hypothetical protein [Rhizobium sp. G21]MBB1248884.1 hypothetical protein [Rhizobium sp. G21]